MIIQLYRFKPDKGFQGAEGTGAGPRDAPVQFEKGSSQAAGDRKDRGRDRDRDRDDDRDGGRGERDYYRDSTRDRDRGDRDHYQDRSSGGDRDRDRDRDYYQDRSSGGKGGRGDSDRDPFGISDIVGSGRQSKRARADS